MLTDRHMARLLDNAGFEINLYLTIENSNFNPEAEKYHYSVEFETTYGSYIKREYEVERTIGDNMPAMVMSGVDESTHIVYTPRWYEGPIDEIGGNIADYPNSNQIVATRVTNIETILSDIWTENIGIGSNGVAFRATPNTWTNNGKLTIKADFPIFLCNLIDITDNINLRTEYDNTNDCILYRTQVLGGNYTNIDKAINYDDSLVNTIPSDKTYFIRSSLKVNGTPTSHKDYCFQILPDAKICLYQDDAVTGDGSPNLHLIISEYPCLVKGYSDPDSDYTESSNPDTEYWHSGYWKDINTGVNYTGVCSTNIPIFRGQQNAQKYLDGDLSESDALNGGSFANKDSSIGGELTGSDIPTVNLSASGVGCYTYAVSEAQLKEIMGNYLFTDNSSLQQTIKDALWTWGNNPIDFMIDCYYVPFSITSFYDTINANLKFGTYQFPNTSYPAVKESNGNRLTLFNTTFEGVYGDWRDYTQFTYDLYLPFVGFFTLDNYKYLNHTVKCEMMFDLSTHNLRYYLFVDGIITDRVDGSVGVNIPLMATDTVNKAKHDRETKYGLVNDSLKLAGSVGQLAGGDIRGAASGVNAVIGGIKKYEDLQTKPSSSVEGSFSSSMNIYDISYAYLRITEKQLILPDKLNQLYNYPSYYMGSASQLSGYCEISDIRLNGFTGTIDEMEQLKRDLMEGVIL